MDYTDFTRERQGYLGGSEGDRSPEFVKNKQNFMLRSNGGYHQEYDANGRPTFTQTLNYDYAIPSNIAGSNTRYNALQNYPNNAPAPRVDDSFGGEGAANFLQEMDQRRHGRPNNIADMNNVRQIGNGYQSLNDILADQFGQGTDISQFYELPLSREIEEPTRVNYIPYDEFQRTYLPDKHMRENYDNYVRGLNLDEYLGQLE